MTTAITRPVVVPMLDDPRKIKAITFDPAGQISYQVGGPTNVTAITPYAEADNVIWFMVEIDGKAVERACARFVVQVIYFGETEVQ